LVGILNPKSLPMMLIFQTYLSPQSRTESITSNDGKEEQEEDREEEGW